MNREEAIKILDEQHLTWTIKKAEEYCMEVNEAIDMAIEALEAQEWDEFVFDMNEFFSIIDNGKIIVMRKGKGKVTVERPAIRMETTICSYGEGSEE